MAELEALLEELAAKGQERRSSSERRRGFGLDGGQGDRLYPDDPNGGVPLAHYDGIIRNNIVWANVPAFDTGIEIHIASRPVVAHNTVVSGDGATGFFSSIDYRFAETDALIANNLTTRISARDGASATLQTNVEQTRVNARLLVGDDVRGARHGAAQRSARPMQ